MIADKHQKVPAMTEELYGHVPGWR